jgi:hypothetical protein
MAACDLLPQEGASLTCRLCSGGTGCSAAWLARVLWVHEVAGSSPASPTSILLEPRAVGNILEIARPITECDCIGAVGRLWAACEEVRIPRHAREAVARHERVVVVSHERPAFVIMHPDDTAADSPATRRGRPLREALGLLAGAALPDPGFADDMESLLADVGPAPDDPWARS